jgi:hypothetical protein
LCRACAGERYYVTETDGLPQAVEIQHTRVHARLAA